MRPVVGSGKRSDRNHLEPDPDVDDPLPTLRPEGRRRGPDGDRRAQARASLRRDPAGRRHLHPPPAALRVQRAGAAHRRQDDGDPPRQAPCGLREEPQRGHGEGPRLQGREVDRRGPGEARHAARGRPHGGEEQRRGPRQPLAVLDHHEAGRRRRARAAPSPRRSTATSADSPSSRRPSPRPRPPGSDRAGRGSWRARGASWPCSRRPTRTAP